MEMNFLQEAALYLGAVVVSVTLFKRLGLGSVLGYLAAGMLIGPDGLNLVGDVDAVMHFGELGVHFLLFVVGLELQPRRLWQMRQRVFGVGGAQMAATAVLLAGIGAACGVGWQTSLLVGLGLSLSSTAFALQLLGERNALGRPHGQAAFAVLLFQDLATIVLLASLPLLGQEFPSHAQAGSMVVTFGKTLGVMALLVASQIVLRPALKFVAAQRVHELFTAASLLVVIVFAQVVDAIGLSMALGAFLAGMLFADSEYRHALEADIEPFKGLLLGLFFMAVGMSVQLNLLLERPLVIAALVGGLLVVKGGVLYVIGRRLFGRGEQAARFALTIGQGGEFAFVLFSQAVARGNLSQSLADLLIAAVTLSMAATPILLFAYERLLVRRPHREAKTRPFEVPPEADPSVIIAGFGRMGQIVGRMLKAMGLSFTALDTNPEHIDFITRFGNKVFYADATRVDLLRAAKADKAKVFVLCISDIDKSLRCARAVMANFPNLTIVARARNRDHAYRLMNIGVEHVIRETFFSSLVLTKHVLNGIGLTFSESQAAIERFQEHDESLMASTYKVYEDEAKLVALSKQARRELRSLFEDDAKQAAEAGSDPSS